jgi:hypothetical protein
MSIAGHVSQRMLAHYSHVRIEAKRKALDALAGTKSNGYVTKHVTKQVERAILDPQVIEKNGGDDGTRTRGLCRDRLGIHVLSATYILAGAAKSLQRTVGAVLCG